MENSTNVYQSNPPPFNPPLSKQALSKQALFLSFASGFLSLSLEVIYIRLFGFYSGGLPQVFAFTLAMFLLAIAFGALYGKDICRQASNTQASNTQENTAQILKQHIGNHLFYATLVDLGAIVGLMLLPFLSPLFLFVGLMLSATLRGVVFPIVHHLGVGTAKTGKAISDVYFANVFGSTIAPILIGFVLLDVVNTQQAYLGLVVLTGLIAWLCLHKQPATRSLLNKSLPLILAMLSAILCFVPEKIIHNLARLNHGHDELLLIENKHGMIARYTTTDNRQIVYGGNMYDGQINTSLLDNHSGLQRAYLPLVVKPSAKKVLVIGLSTGSWAKILTLLPQLEEMTIVELNPAYIELVKQSPPVRDLLDDNRVKIITDDGRRYITRHSDQRFDLILMNTTHYYRNQATNILSTQFLTMVRGILQPDGVFLYNTTGFMPSFYTANGVFEHVYQYDNMVVASFEPIKNPEHTQIINQFAQLKWQNGKAVFKNRHELSQAASEMSTPLIPYDKINFDHFTGELQAITDENMINEYRYGYFSWY